MEPKAEKELVVADDGSIPAEQLARLGLRPALVAMRGDEARRQAEPVLRPLHAAEEQLRVAEQQLQKQRCALDEAPWWRRRAMTALVRDASDAVERAQATVDHHDRAAAPHIARIASAQERLREAEHHASVARLSDRLHRLHLEPPSRTIERGVGMEPPGLSL